MCVAYTVDIRAFVALETVMQTKRRLITEHALSVAAVNEGRPISAGSSTSSTAGRYRCYMLLFATTTNLTAVRPYTKGEEAVLVFYRATDEKKKLSCTAIGTGLHHRSRHSVLFMIVVCLITPYQYLTGPNPVTARSKAWVCGRSLGGIAGPNPVRGMHVCLLCLCVVRQSSLRRADDSFGGVLPSAVHLSVIVKPQPGGREGDLTALKNDRILSLSASECFKRPCARGFQPMSIWISLKLWEGDGHAFLKGSPGSSEENPENPQHIYIYITTIEF